LLFFPKPFTALQSDLRDLLKFHELFGGRGAHGIFSQFGKSILQQYFSDIFISRIGQISGQIFTVSSDVNINLFLQERRLQN
jgi:hypothetical protein